MQRYINFIIPCNTRYLIIVKFLLLELFLIWSLRNSPMIMGTIDEYARMHERSDIALMKEVSYGNVEAFALLMDRYTELVSRTSFRILCDREGSEYVTVKVFVSLWNDVSEYDDRFSMSEWLLRKTCLYSRIRITRRRVLRIFGVTTDVFVNASPVVEDQDDYVTKKAWELFCRAVSHMTPLQSVVYALCCLECMDDDVVAKITGLSRSRIHIALRRAENKVCYELDRFNKSSDYERYKGFLRKVAESLTDRSKLRKDIFAQAGI